jgi:hypothetical protein
MLMLKLVLVPGFLWLLWLAGRRWGPAVAGWLSGLPIVAGPILLIIAMEHGPAFAAAVATSALASVLATVTFIVAYAHGARRAPWPVALGLAFVAWGIAGTLATHAPASLVLSLGIAIAALAAAPYLFPKVEARPTAGRTPDRAELASRMLAGALLTLGATAAANLFGPRWSGLLTVFPVLAIVLAVSSHRAQCAAYAALLLRSMATGMYSLAAFCAALGVALPAWGTAPGFGLALVATIAVLAATRRHLSTPAGYHKN